MDWENWKQAIIDLHKEDRFSESAIKTIDWDVWGEHFDDDDTPQEAMDYNMEYGS